jgi:tyrosinase
MAHTRQNVWKLGGDWADPVLWYARGVARMKARALDEPTGWRFYGAIHGIDPQLWQQLGYLSASDPMPPENLTDRFWKQCQHGSWFFLPWHRGYLRAFEAIIRAEVAKLPGAPPEWALPYWNYFNDGESPLPPAFASPDWPDGQGNNPLFVAQRYGPNNDGNVFVPVNQIHLKAMSDPDYTGVASGGSPGFGGVDTGFEHGGNIHGGIETQPHDWVHGLVGGNDAQQLPGLMSDPDTAGLDPIFWLHHANIDRLWEVWRQNPPTNVNPRDQKWLKGPASLGERAFSMPMPDGTSWDYTPADVIDLGQLGYSYDDLSPATAVAKPSDRLVRLGAKAAAAKAKEGVAMTTGKNVEMVGASQGPLEITGSEARTAVQMNKSVRQKVAKSLAMAPETASPDRIFLNLENVRGLVDATAFHVYVGLPEGADPADHPELLAGSISLFGVRKATLTEGEHGGQGLTFVLDITNIVDALHLQNALEVDSLNVRIVPVKPVPQSAQIRVGRIRIFRQGR